MSNCVKTYNANHLKNKPTRLVKRIKFNSARLLKKY